MDILRLLRERSAKGFETVLAKVRAHKNIWGNERADELAKAAAQSPGTCDICCNVGVGSLPAECWPFKLIGEERFYLSDLGQSTRVHLQQMPLRKSGSLYTNLWRNVYLQDVDMKSSLALWSHSKVTDSQLQLSLRYRVGCLYNQKHHMRFNKLPGMARCPLCRLEDGA